MSVLKRVRENFGGAALGGALALSPAAVQAQEVDYQPPQCEMIEGTHGVPISDQRDMRQEVVRTITARSSRDGISLAVYGDDASVLKDAAQALYDAHKCGLPVIGVVLGSPDEESGVDVYVSGFPTATYEQEHIEAARRLGPQKLHEHLLASIERAESLREELRLTTDAKDTASADSVRTASMNLSQ